MSVADALEQVRARIRAAALDAGRDPSSVKLLAVSKTQPAEAVREAYAAGQRDFGENYVQELEQKARELSDLSDLRWHLIGHLQRNKARFVAPLVALVHSVDTIELARELAKRREASAANGLLGQRSSRVSDVERRRVGGGSAEFTSAEGGGACRPHEEAAPQPLPVLVEVSIAGEAQKHGVLPGELAALLDAIDALPALKLRGLMCVPPLCENAADSRPFFDHLAQLAERYGGRSRLPELSMGMTSDLEHAIAAGATWVRVGTAIFGARAAKA